MEENKMDNNQQIMSALNVLIKILPPAEIKALANFALLLKSGYSASDIAKILDRLLFELTKYKLTDPDLEEYIDDIILTRELRNVCNNVFDEVAA